jgi:hypothetical protein
VIAPGQYHVQAGPNAGDLPLSDIYDVAAGA